MAALNHLLSYDYETDDYIDMEVSSYSKYCSSPREFEFQMYSNSLEKDTTTSPADELFYKGKLLPLHLPPRLKMVEKLLENSSNYEFYSTPLMSSTPTNTSTPYESCNISPSESCRVSGEINPNEYLFDYPNEVVDIMAGDKKYSWTKKLKLIKQSSISSKLKASRAYLKSLFGKSGCSDESCTTATKVADEATIYRLNKPEKQIKKIPFGQIQKGKNSVIYKQQKINEDGSNRLHRRSFSMALKRHSTAKSTSSSNSNGGLPFLKRSNSVNADIENPIQGAIAYCKKSSQLFCQRKNGNEIGLYSFCEEQERPELCRG